MISQFVLYFLCLDAKKVTKKNQGKPERSARFALPTPHIALRKDLRYETCITEDSPLKPQ